MQLLNLLSEQKKLWMHKTKRNRYESLLSLILLFTASTCLNFAIFVQSKNLDLTLPQIIYIRIFVFYTILSLISFYVYSYLENYLFALKGGRLFSVFLNRSIFFLGISIFIIFRTLIGNTSLIDLISLFTLLLFRLTLISLNNEQLDWKNARIVNIKKYFPFFFLWTLTITLFVLVQYKGEFSNFFWPNTDARHYKWFSDALTIVTSEKSYFAIGLPLILLPFNLIAGTYSSKDISMLQILNMYTLPFFTFIIWPLSLILLQKTLLNLMKIRENIWNITITCILIIFMNFLYLSITPQYLRPHDIITNRVMILGLIPAVEIVNLLFINFALYAIVNYKRVNFILVGTLAGLAIISKSSNLILFGPFICFFFLLKGNKVNALKALIIALLVFSIQIGYSYVEYGGGIYPGRIEQVENHIAHNKDWISYENKTYNLNLTEASALDYRFVPINLRKLLSFYYLPIIFSFLAFILLIIKKRKHWVIWSFCISGIFCFGLFHTAFFRFGATFRYYHVILPLWITLVLPAGYYLYKLFTKWEKRIH